MKKWGCLLLILLVFSLSAWAKGKAVSPIITAVEIAGNKTIAENEISKFIFARVGSTFSEDKVKEDLKSVYALGYFSDVTSSFESFAGGIKLLIKVTENPKIREIVIEGNTLYPTAELLSTLDSKVGDLLSFKKMQDDIDKINSRFKKDGYMIARVVDVDTDKKASSLHFKVIEGRVESVITEGNETTHDYVILREMKTKPGSVLNEETLRKDLRQIFNLGFFAEVTPNFEAGSTSDKIVLKLKIKETRSSTVNFGGGFGEREGMFGFVDLSINNLFGTAQGLLMRAQTGQQLSTYQFKYYNPWVMPEKFGAHTALTLRRWLTVGRDIFISTQDGVYNGFDISIGKPLRENYNINWTLGSENVSPTATSSFEPYRSDTIGLGLSFDTRDFWLNPKEGRYYTLDLKQGWKSASASSNFTKAGWDLNHYYTVFENQVLAFHGGAGIGIGDIPVGEIYYAGGANTIRGYYPSEAKQGKRKLITNVELRLNFSELFQGVFFYDWGNAWNNNSLTTLDDFISGWGPGVRVTTPLGPIRLDYGIGKGKTFSEGIMHFSIGQAF